MREETVNKIVGIGMFILMMSIVFVLGWTTNDLWRHYNNVRTVNGLWIDNANRTRARDIAEERDNLGTWICVNIRGMEIEEAFNTCRHEVAHEIFARKCEDDIEKCFEVFNKK